MNQAQNEIIDRRQLCECAWDRLRKDILTSQFIRQQHIAVRSDINQMSVWEGLKLLAADV